MKTKMPRGMLNVYRLFTRESDRAAVVLAGAYLDALLEEVLRSWLEPEAHVHLEPPNGFVSSFGAKYNLAHALGAIPPDVRNHLRLVGAIRNHFAHHVMTAKWNHPNVQKQLAKITSPVTGQSDRERFVRLVTIMSLHLANARLRAPERRALADFRSRVQSATTTRFAMQLGRVRRAQERARASRRSAGHREA